jgi:hypothetical protein
LLVLFPLEQTIEPISLAAQSLVVVTILVSAEPFLSLFRMPL